jgi:hypothetical protein
MKEKKSINIQIRISPSDKEMLQQLRSNDPEFNASKLFRDQLHSYHREKISKNGVGALQIG